MCKECLRNNKGIELFGVLDKVVLNFKNKTITYCGVIFADSNGNIWSGSNLKNWYDMSVREVLMIEQLYKKVFG